MGIGVRDDMTSGTIGEDRINEQAHTVSRNQKVRAAETGDKSATINGSYALLEKAVLDDKSYLVHA